MTPFLRETTGTQGGSTHRQRKVEPHVAQRVASEASPQQPREEKKVR